VDAGARAGAVAGDAAREAWRADRAGACRAGDLASAVDAGAAGRGARRLEARVGGLARPAGRRGVAGARRFGLGGVIGAASVAGGAGGKAERPALGGGLGIIEEDEHGLAAAVRDRERGAAGQRGCEDAAERGFHHAPPSARSTPARTPPTP